MTALEKLNAAPHHITVIDRHGYIITHCAADVVDGVVVVGACTYTPCDFVAAAGFICHIGGGWSIECAALADKVAALQK